jgi:hypothetical protein
MKAQVGVEVYLHHSWTRLLMEATFHLQFLASLPPENDSIALIQRESGWNPVPVSTMWNRDKHFVPTGDWTPDVQPGARYYTNRVIPATHSYICVGKNCLLIHNLWQSSPLLSHSLLKKYLPYYIRYSFLMTARQDFSYRASSPALPHNTQPIGPDFSSSVL